MMLTAYIGIDHTADKVMRWCPSFLFQFHFHLSLCCFSLTHSPPTQFSKQKHQNRMNSIEEIFFFLLLHSLPNPQAHMHRKHKCSITRNNKEIWKERRQNTKKKQTKMIFSRKRKEKKAGQEKGKSINLIVFYFYPFCSYIKLCTLLIYFFFCVALICSVLLAFSAIQQCPLEWLFYCNKMVKIQQNEVNVIFISDILWSHICISLVALISFAVVSLLFIHFGFCFIAKTHKLNMFIRFVSLHNLMACIHIMTTMISFRFFEFLFLLVHTFNFILFLLNLQSLHKRKWYLAKAKTRYYHKGTAKKIKKKGYSIQFYHSHSDTLEHTERANSFLFSFILLTNKCPIFFCCS